MFTHGISAAATSVYVAAPDLQKPSDVARWHHSGGINHLQWHSKSWPAPACPPLHPCTMPPPLLRCSFGVVNVFCRMKLSNSRCTVLQCMRLASADKCRMHLPTAWIHDSIQRPPWHATRSCMHAVTALPVAACMVPQRSQWLHTSGQHRP